MPWNNLVFPLLIVTPQSGTPTGLFVYNGSTAKGNLIAQIVAPGTVTDPVGDTVNAVLNVGKWSPAGAFLQHFGVDANGNVYVVDSTNTTRILIANGGNLVWAQAEPAIVFYNSSGAVIQVVDPQRGGNFQYQDNNSAVQGVLIGAQVGKNTTDPINGTGVGAGITIIDPAFGDILTAVGANISWSQVPFTVTAKDAANTGATNQGPFRSLAAPEQGQAGHVVQRWYGTSVDGTRAAGTVISTTDPPTRTTPELLEVQGTAAVQNASVPASLSGWAKPFAQSGALNVVDGTDGNTYDTQSNTVFVGGAGFTINSTSPQTILSHAVGARTYKIEVWLVISNATAADSAGFAFSGPSASLILLDFESVTTGTAVPGYAATNSLTTQFNGQGVGGNQRIKAQGTVTFSASGTLAFTGKELVATNTVTVFAGSRMTITPVVAT